MRKIKISRVFGQNEILSLIRMGGPFFRNQKCNNESTIYQLAQKLSEKGCVLKASYNADIAGFCGYYANDIDKLTAYLSTIVIFPFARGKGVGSSLISAMIEDCELKKMKHIDLEVANDNNQAISLYKKIGFLYKGKKTSTTSFYTLEL